MGVWVVFVGAAPNAAESSNKMSTPNEIRRASHQAYVQCHERDCLVERVIRLQEVIAERHAMAADNSDNAHYVQACARSVAKWELQLAITISELSLLPVFGPNQA